jgi:hypothetical protein
VALFVKGTNTEIIGTLETLSAVAYAHAIRDDGSPEYSGESRIHWDEQKTVLKDGERVWIGEDSMEYAQSQIEDRSLPTRPG